MYYSINEVPHFLHWTSQNHDAALNELVVEYRGFLSYVLERYSTVKLHFRAPTRPGRHVEVGYQFDALEDEQAEFEMYARSLRRHLRITSESPPLDTPSIKLQRRVDLVPVGAVDVMDAAALRILPSNAKRFLNFDPNVAVGSITDVGLFPLAVILGDWLRAFVPKQAFLAPVPQAFSLEPKPMRWRNVLALLAETRGGLTITCSQHRRDPAELDYAYLCLQYYVGTYLKTLPPDDLTANTAVYRALLSNESLYDVTIEFVTDSKIEVDGLGRDIDPRLFQSAGAGAIQASRTHDSLVGDLAHKPWSTGSAHAQSDPTALAERYTKYFRLSEAVDLILPPYSFRDALPAVKHFVPTPFYSPGVRAPLPRSGGARLTSDRAGMIRLGYLENGQPVDIPLRQLTRHMFVTGTTGSGKSNTIMQVVAQVIDRPGAEAIPVLIVDPVKRDFEELLKQLGLASNIIDFQPERNLRFNPFVPARSVTLYAHCIVLAKAFSMLFPTTPVAYEILVNMIKATYRWKLNSQLSEPIALNHFLSIDGTYLRTWPQVVPTLDEFLDHSLRFLRSLRVSETDSPSDWLREAIEHFYQRWESLKLSALYFMLSPAYEPSSDTLDILFSHTHLVEFASWFDANEVNAAFALIFSMLYEQRQTEAIAAARDGRLPRLSLAVLDEAHRILPAEVPMGDERLISSAKETSVLFSNMIAECRSLGQGLIIGEQSASKISTDVLINSASKFVHTVLYGKDKEFIASALSLSPPEQDHISYLRLGDALVLAPDVYQPTHVNIPKFPLSQDTMDDECDDDEGCGDGE